MLFAYLGPDTMLPVASTLAAVVGVFLMFGRLATRAVAATFAVAARPFLPARKAEATRIRPARTSLRPDAAEPAHAPHGSTAGARVGS